MISILCKCGCGGEVPIGKRKDRQALFINGHQSRGINNPCYGKHYSKESKLKMRKAKLGKSSPHKGKKRPELSGNKNGMYDIHRFGNNAPNYKDSKDRITDLYTQIRTSDKYSDWRTQIFGRDNFTCQECGVRGSWFEAHHKKRFSDIIKDNNIQSIEEAYMCDELWDLDNGITYCKECHKLLKQKGGLL